MSEPKIISTVITKMPRPMPEGMFDPMPKVMVTFDDDSSKELFSYYPDELSFTTKEFTGLTEVEAKELKVKKDKNYLQS